MLTDLVIENFQSVKSARLKLGRLTVVTGPTGSGKSAVIRALRLAAFNRRGTSYIRHGTRTCKAGFGSQDQAWFLAIERAGKSSDSYRVSRLVNHPTQPEGYLDEPEVDVYTKLAGEAPEDVLRLHGLTELNFAAQFDRPYLLDASGAEIARTLGELTNVDLVLTAAREANLRRQRAEASARKAAADAASLASQVQQYAALPGQRLALSRAEDVLRRCHELTVYVQRLQILIDSAVSAAANAITATDRAAAAAPPSLDRIGELAARRARLRELLQEILDADNAQKAAAHLGAEAEEEEKKGHQELHDLLAEAGECPTCGFPVPR